MVLQDIVVLYIFELILLLFIQNGATQWNSNLKTQRER